ncbi:SpvB/TcaC N-terminal domain-containing protein [Taibaiella soli]|uniref:Insecticidal toxin complex protein n=1 Tax=Taibaiella soli TaxID=1649169 RepID=A0A2W2C1I2_9BACT|nr:SpvB/TcaC N-terminal domain-containing protein [Taibaiella soli]PZF73903.1 hypothetical protein DN068_06055 [Taibaiella soli]
MQPSNTNGNGSGQSNPLDRYTNQPQQKKDDSPYYQSQAPTISLPKGGGALKGIDEKFSVNAINGTAGLQVGLPLSPGRGGFTPALSLSYSSGGGNSEFGLGWGLSLPAIQRRTDKKLPLYDDAGESDVFLLAGAEDLVPWLDGQGLPHENYISVDGVVKYSVRRYIPRIEGLFARIELIGDMGSADKWWRVTTKDNITTWYGLSASARIADPADAGRIYKWLPEITIDNKGNVQTFAYKQEDFENVPMAVYERNRMNSNALCTNTYLKHIRYCNRVPFLIDETEIQQMYEPTLPEDFTYLMEAVLDYGDHTSDVSGLEPDTSWSLRNDPFSDFHAGFEIRTYRKCRRVLMFHIINELAEDAAHNPIPTLVRSLDLTYLHDGNTDLQEADMITKISQTGYQQTASGPLRKSLPAMEMDYQPLQWNKNMQSVTAKDFANAPQGLTGNYQWTDLWGEGLPGILSEQNGSWFYKSNLGNGHFAPAVQIARKPSIAGLGTELQWQDLDADGRRQLVSRSTHMPGYFELNDDQQWLSFRSFKNNINIDWNSPFTKMLDLDGDGRADLLLTEDRVWTWYKNEGTDGIITGGQSSAAFDEEKGPRLVLNDNVQSIFLADMNGDGMTDIVRIKNGEICYWPNMGYGRFGAKVTMANAPRFANPDLFNPIYLQLCDISGTGAADIIYLSHNSATAWINLAGNGWSTGQEISSLPSVEPYSKFAVLDFLGNGTGSIVWSSPLPQHASAPIRYVDLMGGIKPYILKSYRNNMGKTISLQYKSSAMYYLEDKVNNTPWATRLPFPVQCLQKVTTTDAVSETSYTQSYSYHHGYYDHEEREFRGFGRVDTTDIDSAVAVTSSGAGNSLDQSPVFTKTWYHTGAWIRERTLLDAYATEYFALDGDVVLPNTLEQPVGLNPQELREAHRSLKGSPLRQEVYALDGTDKESIPYTITSTSYATKTVQPLAGNRYASFLSYQQQSLAWSCERDAADPRVQHSLTLSVDEYGNVLESAAIVYGRKDTTGMPDVVATEQQKMHIVLTDAKYTNDAIVTDDNTPSLAYHLRVPYEGSSYEATLPAGTSTSEVLSFADAVNAINDATTVKILLSCSRTVFAADADAMTPLTFGTMESLAIPAQQYTLAYDSQAMIDNCFDSKVTSAMLTEGKYQQTTNTPFATLTTGTNPEENRWWIASGKANFISAKDRFYTPVSFIDPWGGETTITYVNDYYLLPETVTTPDINTNTPGNTRSVVYDWTLLQPTEMIDENENHQMICYDPLGLPVATAIMGKVSVPDHTQGDSLLINNTGDMLIADSDDDLTAQSEFWEAVDTNTPAAIDTYAKALLQRASWRCIYQLGAKDAAGNLLPARVAMIAREEHYIYEQANNLDTKVPIRISYTDGFGRAAMHKVQADLPSSVILSATGVILSEVEEGSITINEGWIGSGKTVYNNKGNAVMQYEPYFSLTGAYDTAEQAALPSSGGVIGGAVSPKIYYDPLGRAYKTVMPDGTFSKTEWTSWDQTVYDSNDTVLDSDWYATIQALVTPTGTSLSTADKAIIAKKNAAAKAAVHYNTPTIMYLDSLARPFYTVASPGGGVMDIHSYVTLDIIDNKISVTDGLKRKQLQYRYNYLKAACWQQSIDGGTQVSLVDVAGAPLYSWDAAGNEFHFTYDGLRRPVSKEIMIGSVPSSLEISTYGEGFNGGTYDVDHNLRGQLISHKDGSGLKTVPAYDFKGMPVSAQQQFLADAALSDVTWDTTAPTLSNEVFSSSIVYNALGQVLSQSDAGGNITYHTYDKSGQLKTVSVKEVAEMSAITHVQDIHYDAKGQRQSIWYGNNTKTSYVYDPLTYRLTRLLTIGLVNNNILQDLNYAYDAVGNITYIRDNAQKTVFFDNSLVSADQDFTYDALYRLIKAKGREQTNTPSFPTADNVSDIDSTPSSNNPLALRNYTQHYCYDAVGNIMKLKHCAGTTGSYTRDYTYTTGTNRLQSTTAGNGTLSTSYPYTYDTRGNMITMPHLPVMDYNLLNELRHISASFGGGQGEAYYQYSGGQRIRKYTVNTNFTEERLYLGGFERYRKIDTATGKITIERITIHIADDAGRIALLERRTTGTSIIDNNTPDFLQRYVYSNHLGSATLELDDEAEIISYEEYHPYGTTAYQAMSDTIKAVAKRYRFTGKERDDESGLYYHGARYYIPWLGRWCAVDPLEGKYSGWSAYQYCTCNPVMNTDSTGTQNDGKEEWHAPMAAPASTPDTFHAHAGFANGLGSYENPIELPVASVAQKKQLKETMAALGNDQNIGYPEQQVLSSDVYGNGHIGPAKDVQIAVNAINTEYYDRLGEAIAGGFFGSLGYAIQGDKGAFIGQQVDNAAQAGVALHADRPVMPERTQIIQTTEGPSPITEKFTLPSNIPSTDAAPSGKRTIIRDEMQPSHKTSLQRENEGADALAQTGYSIEQNPAVPNSNKNPDYKIEGLIFDCYSPYNSNKSIRGIWTEAADKVTEGQADRIFLNLKYWSGDLGKLQLQFKNYPIKGLKEVIILDNQNNLLYLKPPLWRSHTTFM